MCKQKRKPYPGDLTESEWDEVKNIIKEDVHCGPKGRTKYPRREMFNAIFYILRTGCQWTDLPHDFPPWKSVYAQFLRWKDKRVFEKLNEHLRQLIRKKLGRGELASIGIADSQSVKTTEKRDLYDACKKIKGRKRHLLVDHFGWLITGVVSAANCTDRDGLDVLCRESLIRKQMLPKKVYADLGYSGEEMRVRLNSYGIEL